ncbi:MAG: PrsW family glutamic-type intramembrane protease [Patescibacteria group bacterium]|nr:PrsW family glutamic-type intramembrane protease [Patescibacteria group bacterium]
MNKYVLILSLSFLPSLFWLFIARRIDKKNPEPIKEILRVFLLGIMIALPTLVLAQGLKFFLDKIAVNYFFYIIIISFFVDGLIEEFAKYLILKEGVYDRKVFNEPLDGFVYAVTVATGFAFFENFFYLLSSGPQLIVLRFATPTLMHVLASGIIGYHLGEVKFFQPKNKKFILAGSLFLAVGFHGLYNTIIRFNFFWNIVPLIFLILSVYIYILFGLKKTSREQHPLSQKALFS